MSPKELAEKRKTHKYYVKWSMEHRPEGVVAADLEKAGHFGSEALAVVEADVGVLTASVARPADGSYSCFFHSMDGKTGGELSDPEWFKIFLMLSKRLGDSKTLDAGRKELAAMPFEMMRDIMELTPNCGCAAGSGHKH